MACFRNVVAEPLQLGGDWRVALTEIFSPTVSRVYAPKTPFNNLPSNGNTSSGGVMVELEDW